MTLSVAYLGFEVSDRAAWARFADVIGLGVEQAGTLTCLRVDDVARRIQLLDGPRDDLVYMGWEAADARAFDGLCERLVTLGVPHAAGDAAAAALRGVERYVAFDDPDGLPLEVALGVARAATPFESKLMPGGFVTGDCGLGHIAANCTDLAASSAFLCNVLGARISDYIRHPVAPGLTVDCAFLHTNPRHHSLAYARAPGGAKGAKRLHHFMLEARALEDVGRAYDRVRAAGFGIPMQLGQHPNDRMLSFYVETPSGFALEVGHGGVRVDDADWQVADYDNFSLWGHQPVAA